MANRAKKNYPKHLQEWAQKGDRILNNFVDKIIIPLPKGPYGLCKNYLKSNLFLSIFEPKFKLKGKPFKKYKSICKYGDMIEATIYFLYINYGEQHAYNYIWKHIQIAYDINHYYLYADKLTKDYGSTRK